jgi:hypothetical protein
VKRTGKTLMVLTEKLREREAALNKGGFEDGPSNSSIRLSSPR